MLVFTLIVLSAQLFVTPALADATQVTLTIQNYHGNSLKDVKIELLNSTTNQVMVSGISGSDGKVKLTIIKDATYILEATYLGVKVGRIENWNYSNPNSPKTIRVGVFNLRIRIMSSGQLDPVPNARVNITSSETSPDVSKSKVTDSNGYVTFENLPNGTTYNVKIKYGDRVIIEKSEEITLIDDYDFTFTLDLYRLTLRLKDSSSQPVKNVNVKLWRGEDTGEPFAKVYSGADGNATFKLLPKGTYIFKVEYKSEYIYTSDPFTLSSNKIIDVSLSLKSLIVNIKSKSGNTASGFTYFGKLMYDGNTYAETSTSDGILNFGIVYGNRDYILKILFEGTEIYSGTIKGEDIGIISVTGSIGDFSIKISGSGLFGKLSDILVDSTVRLKFGKYQVEKKLTAEGGVTYHDYPLVEYAYEIILDTNTIGSGNIDKPQHQSIITISPESKQLKIRAISLDNKSLSGKLILILRNDKIGEIKISEESTTLKGLLRLSYNYQFIYMGKLVAEGTIEKEAIDKSTFDILASVSNVKIIAFDHAAENKLVGASIIISTGEYKSTKTTNNEGEAVFDSVPLTDIFTTIYYKGVKVYSSPHELSPTKTSLTISGTGVYQISFKVMDGEKEPLVNAIIEGSIGDYQISGKLDEKGMLTANLVPNGTIIVKVSYLDIIVYEDAHKIDRDRQAIEIISRVFPIRVDVFKITMNGEEPLEKGLIHFESDGREVFVGNIQDGAFHDKLPASNYHVWIEYQGAKVADKLVLHNGPTRIGMTTEVYEIALLIIDLAENPLAGINVEVRRENNLITAGETDAEGKVSFSLAKGEYNINYKWDQVSFSYSVSVKDASSKVLLTQRSPLMAMFISIAASASLGAITVLGIVKSIKSKPSMRGRVSRGRSEGWKKTKEKTLKKNL